MKAIHIAAALVSLALAGSTPAETPKVIEVTARQFEFAPSELHLERGVPVILRFTTTDVAHGFSLRKLKLDADILPGKPVEVRFTPEEAGTYTAVCDHFCGSGHGGMKMKVVVFNP